MVNRMIRYLCIATIVSTLPVAHVGLVHADDVPQPARLDVGVFGGLGMTSFGGPGANDASVTSKYRSTYAVGASVGVRLHPMVAAVFGLRYTNTGPKTILNDIEFGTYRLNYVQVPVLARVMLPLDGPLEPYAVLGPSLGIKTGAGIVQPSGVRIDIADSINSVDVALEVGVGAAFRVAPAGVVTFDVRYSHGLLNVDEMAEGDDATMNRAFLASVGFRWSPLQ